MRVRFKRDRNWTPPEDPRILVAFSPKGGADGDGAYTVRREAGEAAIAAGKAEDLTFNGADPAKFDHDGDKRPGGAKKKTDAEA